MDITDTKVLVACLFGITRFFFGVLPIKIHKCLKIENGDDTKETLNEKRHQQVHCGLALFQAFGGGVLFATCFLHMMPEVYETTIELKKYGLIHSHYPFSQLIVSMGFFLVYFIEELAHFLISRVPDEACSKSKDNNIRTVTPCNKVVPTKETPVIEEFANGDCPTPIKEIKEIETADTKLENEINLESNKDIEQVIELEKLIETKSVTQQKILRGILMVFALSMHSFFEGLAIGLQTSVGSIWYLFIAISIHSATILFCITLELLLANAKLRIIIVHVLILAITSPLGVFLGLLITLRTDMNTKIKSVAVVFLEGISTGTILYITFFEVLNREKERRIYRLRRAACIILGFGLMACLECGEMYY